MFKRLKLVVPPSPLLFVIIGNERKLIYEGMCQDIPPPVQEPQLFLLFIKSTLYSCHSWSKDCFKGLTVA